MRSLWLVISFCVFSAVAFGQFSQTAGFTLWKEENGDIFPSFWKKSQINKMTLKELNNRAIQMVYGLFPLRSQIPSSRMNRSFENWIRFQSNPILLQAQNRYGLLNYINVGEGLSVLVEESPEISELLRMPYFYFLNQGRDQ